MTLHQWVEELGGPFKAAQFLKVRESSISQWVNGHNNPSDKMKMKIHKLSKGRATYQALVESKRTKKSTSSTNTKGATRGIKRD